jgi:hypothetical protein
MTRPCAFLLAVAALALAVCAQRPSSSAKLSGTIDGRQIPDRVLQPNRYAAATRFIAANHRLPTADEEQTTIAADSQRQICGNLRSYLGADAHEAEILRLGIVPTKADIDTTVSAIVGVSEADVRQQYPRRHAYSAVLAAGFAAVLDNGKDPHVVYRQVIAPAGLNGITEDGWLGLLYTARATQEGRERLERDSQLTMQNMMDEAKTRTAKSIAASTGPGGLSNATAANMVNKQVDQLIAAKDPAFRAYLAEYNPDARQHPMNGDHFQYLQQRRNEYWRAVISKLNIRLSDPTLFTACKLADMGVTVPK